VLHCTESSEATLNPCLPCAAFAPGRARERAVMVSSCAGFGARWTTPRSRGKSEGEIASILAGAEEKARSTPKL